MRKIEWPCNVTDFSNRKNMQGNAERRRRYSGIYSGQRRKETVTMTDAEQREAARQFVNRWRETYDLF